MMDHRATSRDLEGTPNLQIITLGPLGLPTGLDIGQPSGQLIAYMLSALLSPSHMMVIVVTQCPPGRSGGRRPGCCEGLRQSPELTS